MILGSIGRELQTNFRWIGNVGLRRRRREELDMVEDGGQGRLWFTG